MVTDTSKQLITALEKADWTDRLLILAALSFFILIVLFILKQRIVDRGIRIAFWWTRFLPLPDFSGDEALLAQEEGNAGIGVKEVVQTVATTVSSLLASTVLSSAATSASPLAQIDKQADSASSTLTSPSLSPSSVSSPHMSVSSSGEHRSRVEL